MTILVTGAGGQVGHELALRGAGRVTALDRARLDIADHAAIAAAIAEHRAAVLVNAAAYTAVDKAESEAEAAYAINRDAVGAMARACRQAGIPLLHLSTDYVFDGGKAGPYVETDTPNPSGVYGRSKLEGEEALRAELPEHLILRVSWVFGAHGNNFVRTMLRLGSQRPGLRVVADQAGAPTHAGAIADTLLALAARHQAGQALPWGTYHYTGAPVSSWHAFAVEIFRQARELGLLEREPAVHAITTADYPTPARRPANSALDNSLARARLGLASPDWRAGLREVLTTWKNEA